jgi:hypothetical protein
MVVGVWRHKYGYEWRRQWWWMHVMRCFDIVRRWIQWHVPVLMTPPARLPVEPSAVLLPVPAAASGAAIGIGVASAVGAAGRPSAPSSVEPFAALAVEVRHESAALVVVTSHTGSAAPTARRVRRRLLRYSGSPLHVVRRVRGRRFNGSSRDSAIAMAASVGAANLLTGYSLLI